MIRCVIHNAPCEALTDPDFVQITGLAQNHKLTGFLFEAIPHLQSDQIPDAQTVLQWKKSYRSLLAIEANQRYEYDRLLKALDEAGIRALPVKGFAVADCYPQSFLRSMSDLDILYDEEKKDELLPLMESLGYHAESFGNGTTDQFFTETGLHVEMHRSLYETRMPAQSEPFFTTLLSRTQLDASSNRCALSEDEQYLYLLLHTYKHFIFAGTGIRSVLDVYLYRRRAINRQYLTEQCRKFGIETFLTEFEALAEAWFGSGTPSAITERLGDYIAGGGVYGSEENKIHSEMIRSDNGRGVGKLKYIFRRFFQPFRVMKIDFPILKKLPFLLPFFWIYRAVYALIHRREKLSSELQQLGSYDSRQADKISELMKELNIR